MPRFVLTFCIKIVGIYHSVGGGLEGDGFGFRTIKIEGVFMVSCSPGAPGAPAHDPDGQGASDRWDSLPGLDARCLG